MVISLQSGRITEHGGGGSNDPVVEVYSATMFFLLSAHMLQ